MTVIPSVQKLHTQMHFQITLLIEPISLAIRLPFDFSFDRPLDKPSIRQIKCRTGFHLGGGVSTQLPPIGVIQMINGKPLRGAGFARLSFKTR